MFDLMIFVDLGIVAVSSVLFLWWARLSRLSGGRMGVSFALAASAAALFAGSGFLGIALEFNSSEPFNYLDLGHRAFEVLFLILLAAAMQGVYSAWDAGISRAKGHSSSRQF